jgi:predicted RNA binding protein YcfA (HicA-like mRNA interferase family)
MCRAAYTQHASIVFTSIEDTAVLPDTANHCALRTLRVSWPGAMHITLFGRSIAAAAPRFFMVVIITTINSKDLIKQLEADGWVLRGSKGSHHVFVHPNKPGHISVPHPKKDLGEG